ncbi:MAG: Holliday junction resolvase RuvX [Tepidisphaera sp.]
MRYIAVDLGDARTGLAVGDDVTRIVSPLEVVECPTGLCGGEALLDLLQAAIDRVASPRSPCELVIGLPLNMDDTEGPRAKIVRTFAQRLAARTGRPVHFQDERLTSSEADWSMARSGMTRKQKKERRDALAAAAILRDFLARPTQSESPDAVDEH